MAEILIRAKTNGPTGAHWQRGDIVFIGEDGHTWGRYESRAAWIAAGGSATDWPAEFYVLKVPGLARSVIEQRFLGPRLDADGTTVARSLWRWNVDGLANAVRNRVLSNGEVTVGTDITRTQAESVLLIKTTATSGSLL